MREVLRLLALPLAVLLCGYPLTVSDDQRVAMLVVVAAGAAINALVLWSDGAVTFAAAAFAGAYACSLYVGDVGLDPVAPLFAVALVVFIEICDTALAVPALRPVDRGVLLALARSCARVTVVAMVASAAVLAGSAFLGRSGGGIRVLAMAGGGLAVWAAVQLSTGERVRQQTPSELGGRRT
jgi:hypothetical protein